MGEPVTSYLGSYPSVAEQLNGLGCGLSSTTAGGVDVSIQPPSSNRSAK